MASNMLATLALVFIVRAAWAYCPEAFEHHGNSCYKMFGLKASWVEAKKYCSIFGGDLAIIDNAEEEQVIEGILQRIHGNGSISQETYWVDGSDILAEGEWRWMKDNGNSKLITEYTHWAPGQPDNDNSNEHCLEIRYDFKLMWNDLACDTKESFICEASLDWTPQEPEPEISIIG